MDTKAPEGLAPVRALTPEQIHKGLPPVTPEQVVAALRHAGNLHHEGPHSEVTGEELQLIRSYAPEYTLSVCTARILARGLCDVLGGVVELANGSEGGAS